MTLSTLSGALENNFSNSKLNLPNVELYLLIQITHTQSYVFCVKKLKSNKDKDMWFACFHWEDYQEHKHCSSQSGRNLILHKLEVCQHKTFGIRSKEFFLFQSNMQCIRLTWLQSYQQLILWIPSCTWFH